MIAKLKKLDHNTIVTVGDAVQSFIRAPDTTTKDCCLVPGKDIAKTWIIPRENRHGVAFQKPKRVSWFTTVSWRRWVISLLLTNGFGNFDLNFTVGLDILNNNSITTAILLANLPQAIIAFLYLTYNGLFTVMLANREWTQYSVKRAPLRVTDPTPSQRSTYFLSLPYTFSIPLQLAFAALHWLVSQSVFLARIDWLPVHQWNLDNNGTLQSIEQLYKQVIGGEVYAADDLHTTLGYSAPAILTSIAVGTAVVVVCLLVAAIARYPAGGMPLGGTNSALISAACHVIDANGAQKEDEAREEIVDRPLQWGVSKEGSRDEVGHCSFSDGEVRKPVVGLLYAGMVSSSQ
ncbi:hypothetical protein SLS60_011119 [Paraconiothyrium brasiliense]|uniref:Uncharacterized protein n=1 Tax=Paraconiothyrium brasiliense TaxID=300254 RepID=A0ABR3QKM8_9PLEO